MRFTLTGIARGLGAMTLGLVLLALVTACGGAGGGGASAPSPPHDWTQVRAAARGQTVNWWMYGGDARVNAYVRERVVPAAAALGVTLKVVPVSDTADAVQRVISERDAGRDSGGAVDLIWINGENFALGRSAGLWWKGWAGRLPNARLVDQRDPAIRLDFGVPVDGQESPWSRAALVFAYDPARLTRPPHTVAGLLAYARSHPGRVTYPAPPDFTGSAFVRLVVQSLGEDEGMRALADVKPFLYQGGASYPKSEAELDQLFGNGQVDIATSYDPAFVLSGVRAGTFPARARPFSLDRTLVNTSFVAIPANAAHREGAEVIANLLLSPRLQGQKANPAILGVPTVLDLGRLSRAQGAAFRARVASPYLLGPGQLGASLAELPAADVTRLEKRWMDEVLR